MWTNSLNYVVNYKKDTNIGYDFCLQLHSVTIKNIFIKNWVCGAKPKLTKFDQKKPFMDELVKLSRKQKMRHMDF